MKPRKSNRTQEEANEAEATCSELMGGERNRTELNEKRNDSKSAVVNVIEKKTIFERN